MPNTPSPYALQVSSLNQATARDLTLTPDEKERDQIAKELGFDAVRKLRFEARVETAGKRDWRLSGKLGATIVQPCVTSLAPVTTRIDVDVNRNYLARFEEVLETGSETEMPEDDTLEPLGTHIDPFAVMIEALAIAAPDFPRASDAAPLETLSVTEPGRAALTDDDVKPFAGLAALKAQLENGGEDDG